MLTEIVPPNEELLKCAALKGLIALRQMSMDEFIDKYGGTLRKAHRQGLDVREHALKKRVQFEFGDAFECIPRSRVTDSNARSVPGAFSFTESLWHADRIQLVKVFPEDQYCLRYVKIARKDTEPTEGLALVVTETSAQFIPTGHLVLAVLTEYNTRTKNWSQAKIPF